MQFQSWQSVKVTDEALATHGRAGRVTSATEYTDGDKEVVDVQLDGDTEITTFETSQLAALSS